MKIHQMTPTISYELKFDAELDADNWDVQIGGRPDSTSKIHQRMNYFCGLRSADETEISVFLSFSHDDDGFATMMANRNRVVSPGRMFEVTTGEKSRGEAGVGIYSPQRYRAREASDDLVDTDSEHPELIFPFGGMKAGGSPAVFTASNYPLFEGIASQGFQLITQIPFPGDSRLDGTWIFADGYFWLFRRLVNSMPEWICCWDA